MCGVAGIVRFTRPAQASDSALAAVCRRLAHRGPDGTTFRYVGAAALGHTRLAMTDREGGTQPFVSACGRYTLVYNGELYNDAALRAKLGGPFRTRSDTETVVEAWARWGPASVDRLDGMFAFFVWDEARQIGHAVRDPLGVKPLAYLPLPERGLAFASEAQALLPLLGTAPRADLEIVVEQLVAAAFSGTTRSPFAGIDYLQPGQVLEVTRAERRAWSYYRWAPSSRGEPPSPAALRDALGDAVRACVRADVPLGIFLSGGLDSTAIAALARPALDGQPAFSLELDRCAAPHDSVLIAADDAPYARRAAAEHGLVLRPVRLPRERLAEELRAIARANDAIPAWEQELSQRSLARAAAEAGLRGVLVGDAADETHHGYHFLLDEAVRAAPERMLDRLGAVPIRREVDPDPGARLSTAYRTLMAERAGPDAGDPLIETSQLIVARWLPRLLHNGDVHCMAFGIEPRVPFASRALLALAARVPPSLAFAGGVEKRVLRAALRGVVGAAFLARKKSALPRDPELGVAYQEEVRQILRDPHPLVATLVDGARLAPLLSAARPSEPERAQLFRVACLHHWAVAHHVASP